MVVGMGLGSMESVWAVGDVCDVGVGGDVGDTSTGWTQTPLGSSPFLPRTHRVTLGKSLSPSMPQFPHLPHGDNDSTCLLGLW